MAVHYIPEGYHTVTPYLTVRGASRLLQFVKDAFDAQEIAVMRSPDGAVRHGEVRIGDSIVMMGEAGDSVTPMPAMLYVYVTDADAMFARATKAGGAPLRQPETQFYGDRHGAITDPCGNQWWIATHVEDVSPEEMTRRIKQQAGQHA
jgi:PhnB protein